MYRQGHMDKVILHTLSHSDKANFYIAVSEIEIV